MNIIYAWMLLLFCESAAGKSSIIQLRTNKHYTAFNEINKFFSAIQLQLDVVQTDPNLSNTPEHGECKKKSSNVVIFRLCLSYLSHITGIILP